MNRRLVLLSLLAVALGAYVILEREPTAPVVPGGEAPVTPKAPSPGGGAVKLNPLEGLDAGRFTAMLERPLFNPGRAARPPEPPPPPPVVEEPPPEVIPETPGPLPSDFKVLAISVGPSGRVAAVRIVQTGEVLYLREGQPVQSWSVLAVGDRTVEIGTPEQKVELSLFEGEPGEGSAIVEEAPPVDTPPDIPQIEPEPPLDGGG